MAGLEMLLFILTALVDSKSVASLDIKAHDNKNKEYMQSMSRQASQKQKEDVSTSSAMVGTHGQHNQLISRLWLRGEGDKSDSFHGTHSLA
jgi:hypothetical protein